MMSSNYDDKKKRLVEIIKDKGIVFQHVKLSSDIQTDYYYDFKTVLYDGEGLSLTCDLMLELITSKFSATKSIGGLEIGSIPLTTSIVMKSTEYGRYKEGLTGFTIRKIAKIHGLLKRIEGKPRQPVVVVDDVLTTGNSIWEAIQVLRDGDYRINGVVCVMDREEGTTNVLKDRKVKYYSLFKHSDFKPFIDEQLRKRERVN
jgi:orotate phosphoribosyltransferase